MIAAGTPIHTHHSAQRARVALLAVAVAVRGEVAAAHAGVGEAALEDDGRVGGDAPEAWFDEEVLDRRAAVRRAVRAFGAADALVEVAQSAVVVLLRWVGGSSRVQVLGERIGLRKE